MYLEATMTVKVVLVVDGAEQVVPVGQFELPCTETIDPDTGRAQYRSDLTSASPTFRVLVGIDPDSSGQYTPVQDNTEGGGCA